MKIIIVGAGRIGTNLAKSLADENNEVYLIDKNEQLTAKISEKLDVKVIAGDGADPATLEKAQVKQADLVLAVTTSDETNLVVCSLAGLYGAKRRIARVRNLALSKTLNEFGFKHFNIDEIINPELLAAQEIVKTIQAPGAREVADFAEGRIFLRGFDIPAASPLCKQKIGDFRDENFPWPFLIISIIRDNNVIIPKGETTIEAGDLIYVLLPAHSLAEFLTFVNPDIKMPKKIVIYGGTITGKHVALALSKKIKDIIVLEENTELAKDLAEELGFARVINGSALEGDILTESGIEAADSFIAATESDHSNLISSVLAKKMGAKFAIITTQHPDYLAIVDSMNVDAIVNPHHLAVEQILHLVRGRGIRAVAKLMEGDAEVLEFVPEEGSPVTRDYLKNIKFPKNAIVGAVYSGSDVVLPSGDTKIKEGEKVIVFCQESAVKRLQELFTRRKFL